MTAIDGADPTRPALRDEHTVLTYGRLSELLLGAGRDQPAARAVLRVGSAAADVARLLAAAAAATNVLVIDDQATDWELARAAAALETHESPGRDGPVLYLCSSGTGGRPKLVELDWASALRNARDLGRALRYGPGDRIWVSTAPSHLYGLGAGVLAGLLSGATIDLRRGLLGPGELGDHLLSSGTTVLLSVPFLLRRYIRELQRDEALAARLRLRVAVAAGEAVEDGLIDGWRQATGVPLLTHYGLTEGGHVSLGTGSAGEGVGRAIEGVDVRVEDHEILVRRRPPAVPYRIVNTPDDPRGWCRTGDLGRVDDDGRIHLTGRRGDRINVAGKKVDPAEVERVLRRCAPILDAAVLGAPGATGDEVVAFVVVRPGFDDAALRSELARTLSAYKLPRRIIAVEQIPRTLTGKTRRDRLLLTLAERDFAPPAP